MKIGEVLREKRKAAGLTQEQLANALGITAPAVNKWERGLSCPDLTLLPVLARLLKTDLNTLLSSQNNMTDREIALFTNTAVEKIRTGTFAEAFSLAMEKLREDPRCARLRHTLAMMLDETLMTVTKPVPLFEKEGHTRQAEQLAKAAQAEQEAYGLWQYSAYLAPLQLAVARKDAAESLRILSWMPDAVIELGNLPDSPLCCHQPRSETPKRMMKQLLPPLLADLETNPDYVFLRDDPDTARLIDDRRAKAEIP